jgi:hypothetical protein
MHDDVFSNILMPCSTVSVIENGKVELGEKKENWSLVSGSIEIYSSSV